jgi:hypothetical protein
LKVVRALTAVGRARREGSAMAETVAEMPWSYVSIESRRFSTVQ